jgi:hypothetical protein
MTYRQDLHYNLASCMTQLTATRCHLFLRPVSIVPDDSDEFELVLSPAFLLYSYFKYTSSLGLLPYSYYKRRSL